MKKTYKKFMINTIMSSTTDDVYLAVLQEKPEYMLSHFSELFGNAYMPEESYNNYVRIQKEVSKLGITNQKEAKKLIASCAVVNRFAVLVRIGDKLWDIYNQVFVDLNMFSVVRYNKLSDIYKKDEYRPIMYNPQNNPVTHELTAGISLAYWEPYFEYQHSIEYEDYDTDYTDLFKQDIGLTQATRK